MSSIDDIEKMKNEIDEYQSNYDVCAELTPEHCRTLAELRTVYNSLMNITSVNEPGLFSTQCKAVNDAMKDVQTNYANMSAAERFVEYRTKYEEIMDQLKKLVRQQYSVSGNESSSM